MKVQEKAKLLAQIPDRAGRIIDPEVGGLLVTDIWDQQDLFADSIKLG